MKPLTELLKNKVPEDINITDDSKGETVLREYVKLLRKVIEYNEENNESCFLSEKDTKTFYLAVRNWLNLGAGFHGPFLATSPPKLFMCETDFCLGRPLFKESVCSKYLRSNKRCSRKHCLMRAFGSLIFKAFSDDYKKIFDWHAYEKVEVNCANCGNKHVEYQCGFSIFKRFMCEYRPFFSTKKCSACGENAQFSKKVYLKSLPEVVRINSFKDFKFKHEITIDEREFEN